MIEHVWSTLNEERDRRTADDRVAELRAEGYAVTVTEPRGGFEPCPENYGAVRYYLLVDAGKYEE